MLSNMNPPVHATSSSDEAGLEPWMYGVVGGGADALVLLIVVIAICGVCRRRKKEKGIERDVEKGPDGNATPAGEGPPNKGAGRQTPPPFAKGAVEPAAAATDQKPITNGGEGPQRGEAPAKKPEQTSDMEGSSSDGMSKTPGKQGCRKVSGSKSKSSDPSDPSDTLKGYPASPDERKEMIGSQRGKQKVAPAGPRSPKPRGGSDCGKS